MTDTTKTRTSLFEQVAGGYDCALESVADGIAGDAGEHDPPAVATAFATLAAQLDERGREALARVTADALQIFAHSFFAVLDGATEGEDVRVTDVHGVELEEGLHEHWVEFLLDTGRMGEEE